MTSPEDRAVVIKKLLNKAEAKGTTEEERDAYNAKATKLMIQWGIEDAMLAGADATKIEKIVNKRVRLGDVPKSYVYEYVCIGVAIADVLGCRGFFQATHDRRTDLILVGFESDVDRVMQLFQSLSVQCTLTLGPWYRAEVTKHGAWMTGTDKYQAKRSFIRGFSRGVAQKLKTVKQVTTAQAELASPGTDLVLVNREARVTDWIGDNMQITSGTTRHYRSSSGRNAGYDAGTRADVGQGTMGGQKSAIGG